MTLNGAIMQLVEMRENSMMPVVFKPYFDKVIETISECVEPSEIPHWIPCSERLPEEEQTVLVTCSDGRVYIYDRLEACDYEYDDMRFWEDNMGCYQPREDVIAWMPLPEPYQEDES